jgi:hypothetical protein
MRCWAWLPIELRMEYKGELIIHGSENVSEKVTLYKAMYERPPFFFPKGVQVSKPILPFGYNK